MAFVRFVVPDKHPESGLQEGLFRLAYRMREDTQLTASHREELGEMLDWLDKNLPVPDRFNRTKSKGHYRRNTRGIAWIRDSATKYFSRLIRIKQILESYGHEVMMIRESRVGYIVYEDEFQVVAEPFADTQTNS